MIHKLALIFAILLLAPGYARAQTLSIDECYQLAENNYPLIKQMGLIERAKEYSIDNANKGSLPQINISGQATYQSDVVNLPVSIPNQHIPVIPKDQYRLFGEVAQPITNMYILKGQKELIAAKSEIEHQKIEVELYQLKERINQIFFGILLLDEQIKQVELLKRDLQSGIDKTTVAIQNGVAIVSSLENLKAEMLNADQRAIELRSNRGAFSVMLSHLINQPVTEHTLLQKPERQSILPGINRPELKLFDLREQSFNLQDRLTAAKKLPLLSVFFQGGMGRPGLDMFSRDLKAYYITGIRLNWNLTSFYTDNNERQINLINQRMVNSQRETFLFNTSLNLSRQNAEITRMDDLMKTDNEIIYLREKVKNATKVQLENGTATANDYLISVNAEDKARQNLILHEIQLLQAQYDYRTTAGDE